MYELQSGILCLSCPQKDESIRRLASELAAAKRGPVVEWRKFLEYERASCGAFRLVVHGGGWYLTAQGLERAATVDSGEETGPAGKSAAEAAYRKAAGL